MAGSAALLQLGGVIVRSRPLVGVAPSVELLDGRVLGVFTSPVCTLRTCSAMSDTERHRIASPPGFSSEGRRASQRPESCIASVAAERTCNPSRRAIVSSARSRSAAVSSAKPFSISESPGIGERDTGDVSYEQSHAEASS